MGWACCSLENWANQHKPSDSLKMRLDMRLPICQILLDLRIFTTGVPIGISIHQMACDDKYNLKSWLLSNK
ncbi:hypothetical protein B0189_05565 [Moraxella cuniculi]|nr:hypothetical protein B0189_05565 [Moraxella cuniculi]